MTVALIDADVICYSAAALSQEEIQWEDDEDPQTTLMTRGSEQLADAMIRDWTKAAECKSARIIMSDPRPNATFRYQVHPEYKAQRKHERPALWAHLRDHLTEHYDTLVTDGLEGDDVMGLLATGPNRKKYRIVSIDKDMMTVPAEVFDPQKGTLHRVTEFRADYHWMFQTLVGDTVDNYKGAPGVGPVKARNILLGSRGLPDMVGAAIRAFAEQWDDARWGEKCVLKSEDKTAYDEFLMNARCARILRYGDYDKDRKSVRLWAPEEEDIQWIDL